MQFINQKEEAPFAFYKERFTAADPAEISARLGLPFENGGFSVTLLGTTYRISHPDCVFSADREDALGVTSLTVQVLLLRLLLLGKPAPETEDFKSFSELPWGEVYQKPFSGRILNRAAFTFGTRLDDFRRAAEKLGGKPISQGDAAYEFRFTENYRLRLILWEADDEFPPSAQLLYSANFPLGFSADDRVIAAETLLNSLKRLI